MTTMSLAEARAHLSRLADSAEKTHERFDVTRNGRRSIVIISAEDYDGMEETIAVLSDPDAMEAIREHERNPTDTVSAEEMEAELRRLGRIT